MAIECKDLSKHYGKTVALDHLSIQINKGQIVGYLGPNGAGKTTTIRLLLGLVKPTSGSATIFGLDSQKDKVAIHENLAYVPGESNLWPDLTGAQALDLLANLRGHSDDSYRQELIERFKLDTSRKFRTYSKGNKQKVALIGALMTRSSLLILDEPTAGLDPLMEVEFRGCIHEARANGQTVFLSSHILSEVEALCDQVYILRDGKLIESGNLGEFKHLSSSEIVIQFKDSVPDISAIRGVALLSSGHGHLRFKFNGDFNELLKHISNFPVISFFSHEPSLEELFVSLYGK
ncbi:MAG: ABC transporter ATP-binding protein [Acidimicrobiales bacterium]|nr:ABC transporter ATP-binding protein [Acidimicrobiales bacterium]